MARVVFPVALLFAGFVLESRLGVFGVKLDILALFAYYSGLRYGPVWGLGLGAAVGLAEDGMSGGILGPGLIGKGTVGYLAAVLTTGFFKWTPLLGAILLFLLTAVDSALSYVLLATFTGRDVVLSELMPALLIQSGVNAAFGPFLSARDDAPWRKVFFRRKK